jgi:hypothetical protein
VQSAAPNQVVFQVPAGFPTGPAQLNLNNGSADAFPIVIQVDGPPPVITSVVSAASQAAVDGAHPGNAGDVVGVLLQNLDPTTVSNPGRVHLVEGTTDLTALAVSPTAQPGIFQAWFALSPSLTSQQVQLVVTVDGVTSNAVIIAIR